MNHGIMFKAYILEVAVKSCGQKVAFWGVEAADRYRLAKWAAVRAFMEAFEKVKKKQILVSKNKISPVPGF